MIICIIKISIFINNINTIHNKESKEKELIENYKASQEHIEVIEGDKDNEIIVEPKKEQNTYDDNFVHNDNSI